MDKYFEAKYDPMLDFPVPDDMDLPDGIITDEAFEGWNLMLRRLEERKHLKLQKSEGRIAKREAKEARREEGGSSSSSKSKRQGRARK